MIDAGTWRRFAIAAVGSGAVHAAIIAFGHIELPEPQAPLPPLAVRIFSAPPPAAATPAAASRKRIARAPASVPLISAPSPIVVPSEAETMPDSASVAETEPAAPSEPVVVAKAEPSTYTPEPGPARTLPRKGRITYNVVSGRDRFPVGRTVQSWAVDGDRYQLASTSETTGIVDLFRSQHRNYFSRGTVTREGLRPETFLVSRDRGRARGIDEARARFDWDAASITLGPASAQRAEPLLPRSQDLVSMMFQLGLDPPPPGRMRLPVTNGSRLDVYEIEVLPEEAIETPLGTLRALPVKQVRIAREETMQVWLASEYRYLPVRIVFFNRDGEPAGEQMVSEIRLSEE